MIRENESLQGQLERSRDRELLRAAKRDLEEVKRHNQELQTEIIEL